MTIALVCFRSTALHLSLANNGHKVVSFDLLPAKHNGYHIEGDVTAWQEWKFDAAICFPPCTYLAKAQYHLLAASEQRRAKRDEAVKFVQWCQRLPVKHLAIENPIGYLAKAIGQPTQIVRPWFFGDPYTKDVCLWLKNLPPLISTCYHPAPKYIGNHVNSRMSAAEKSDIKSSWDYFPGMCQAIASQWFPR